MKFVIFHTENITALNFHLLKVPTTTSSWMGKFFLINHVIIRTCMAPYTNFLMRGAPCESDLYYYRWIIWHCTWVDPAFCEGGERPVISTARVAAPWFPALLHPLLGGQTMQQEQQWGLFKVPESGKNPLPFHPQQHVSSPLICYVLFLPWLLSPLLLTDQHRGVPELLLPCFSWTLLATAAAGVGRFLLSAWSPQVFSASPGARMGQEKLPTAVAIAVFCWALLQWLWSLSPNHPPKPGLSQFILPLGGAPEALQLGSAGDSRVHLPSACSWASREYLEGLGREEELIHFCCCCCHGSPLECGRGGSGVSPFPINREQWEQQVGEGRNERGGDMLLRTEGKGGGPESEGGEDSYLI